VRTAPHFGPADRGGLVPVPGGVTAAGGFRATGIAAGLKRSGRPDLALVTADEAVAAAVTLTTNSVRAAPCDLTERHAADGRARAVVINSGNANACTGDRGHRDALATAEAVGEALGVATDEVLVCSTGIIGVPLDMPPLLDGIPRAVADLDPDGGARAAQAITTTDSAPKEVAVRVEDSAGSCTIGGMVKGAGMIEPAMATMIAVLTTDAPLAPSILRSTLRDAVARTFNRISVDACGSTNDTVVLLASGHAEPPPRLTSFQRALEAVCADLARAVVADGEGTTKVADIHVTGAADGGAATTLARAVAGSVLFRAALHGADPNWGRIIAAMGTTDVPFDPGRVSIAIAPGGRPEDAITLCRFGVAATFDRGQATAAMSKPHVELIIDVGAGPGTATFLTADITPDYVAENAYYTT
jgi:glutamate N-acetyltransferase / amino-acid N-acetyltransferase